MKKIFLYGNWKMHMLPKEAESFCSELLSCSSEKRYDEKCIDIALFPPFISIAPVVRLLPENGIFKAGAQDGWYEDRGRIQALSLYGYESTDRVHPCSGRT